MAVTKREERIRKLYGALKRKDKHVGRLYGDFPPEDPLLRHSSADGNTFLHMAIRFRQLELVSLLLDKLKEHGYEDSLSTVKNNDGDTILHELAASDEMIDAAKKVVGNDSKLLIALNNFGETPIFCAVRQGQTAMFRFLGSELEGRYPDDVKKRLQREDETTILHIAVTTEQFELADDIAKKFECLIAEKDQDGMTALQYLASNGKAFEREKKITPQNILKDYAYRWKRAENQPFIDRLDELLIPRTWFARYEVLQSLISILVQKDTTWITSINSQIIMESTVEMPHEKNIQESPGRNFSKNERIEVERKEIVKGQENESPLFLAVMSNIPEIVQEIFLLCPEAIKHVNKERMNILQVAIHYSNIETFELIVGLKMLPKRLLSSIDGEGNSLLHMVGASRKGEAREKVKNPAVQLHDEYILFQRVKAACNRHIIKPLNRHRHTAEELFAARNQKLHKEAMEWLMRSTENCTILSVFIATIAFAAAYTVPGGPNQNTGIPLLNSNPWFVVFVVADVISLAFALSSVAVFINILTSSFLLEDFKTYGLRRLISGVRYMGGSILMMSVAFAATIVLVMTNTTKIPLWAVVGFFPAFLFIVSFAPLRSLIDLQDSPEWMSKLSEHVKSGLLKSLSSFFLTLGSRPGKESKPQSSQLSQV